VIYEKSGRSVGYFEQQNSLPEIRKEKGFEWLKEVPSQSMQMALRNLSKAFDRFFDKKAEYPKPHKKGKSDSITFPQGNRLHPIKRSNKKMSYVLVPKLGPVKFRQHRQIVGEIKSCTISRQGGFWYVSFLSKKEEDLPAKEVNTDNAIGLDMGVSKTIALSTKDDKNIDTEGIKKLENKIARNQRRKAKRSKYSKRWNYYNRIEQKLHSKIARKRHEFLNKTSFRLVKNHSLIVIEDLLIKNMSKSSKGSKENPGKKVAQKSGLNRAILRQGWGIFRRMLEYKAKWKGHEVIAVPPKDTSRRCRKCGYTAKSNRLTQSEFHCQKCGHTENADYNAAKNILRLGMESLGLALEAPSIPSVVLATGG